MTQAVAQLLHLLLLLLLLLAAGGADAQQCDTACEEGDIMFLLYSLCSRFSYRLDEAYGEGMSATTFSGRTSHTCLRYEAHCEATHRVHGRLYQNIWIDLAPVACRGHALVDFDVKAPADGFPGGRRVEGKGLRWEQNEWSVFLPGDLIFTSFQRHDSFGVDWMYAEMVEHVGWDGKEPRVWYVGAHVISEKTPSALFTCCGEGAKCAGLCCAGSFDSPVRCAPAGQGCPLESCPVSSGGLFGDTATPTSSPRPPMTATPRSTLPAAVDPSEAPTGSKAPGTDVPKTATPRGNVPAAVDPSEAPTGSKAPGTDVPKTATPRGNVPAAVDPSEAPTGSKAPGTDVPKTATPRGNVPAAVDPSEAPTGSKAPGTDVPTAVEDLAPADDPMPPVDAAETTAPPLPATGEGPGSEAPRFQRTRAGGTRAPGTQTPSRGESVSSSPSSPPASETPGTQEPARQQPPGAPDAATRAPADADSTEHPPPPLASSSPQQPTRSSGSTEPPGTTAPPREETTEHPRPPRSSSGAPGTLAPAPRQPAATKAPGTSAPPRAETTDQPRPPPSGVPATRAPEPSSQTSAPGTAVPATTPHGLHSVAPARPGLEGTGAPSPPPPRRPTVNVTIPELAFGGANCSGGRSARRGRAVSAHSLSLTVKGSVSLGRLSRLVAAALRTCPFDLVVEAATPASYGFGAGGRVVVEALEPDSIALTRFMLFVAAFERGDLEEELQVALDAAAVVTDTRVGLVANGTTYTAVVRRRRFPALVEDSRVWRLLALAAGLCLAAAFARFAFFRRTVTITTTLIPPPAPIELPGKPLYHLDTSGFHCAAPDLSRCGSSARFIPTGKPDSFDPPGTPRELSFRKASQTSLPHSVDDRSLSLGSIVMFSNEGTGGHDVQLD
ncbi:hypothetical protein DIPPA_11197 [Diplonema papillatum]|nr:hypothetical protein DIPPA_11197 [Diplonema papillatum]